MRVERQRPAGHSLTVRGFSFALVCALILCVQTAHAGGRDARSQSKPAPLTTDELSRAIPAKTTGLRREVLDLALRAYQCGRARGQIEKSRLTIIDYSLPSTQKRLWVIDLERRRMLFNELVAHGRESGENTAVSFSNSLGSHKSSLGLFRASQTYIGRHGYSLNLAGLEPGINDRAYERRVVVQGRLRRPVLAEHGRLGQLGLPGAGSRVSHRVIDGSRQRAGSPSTPTAAVDRSSYLSCDAPAAAITRYAQQ
jgi:hypothetical protein